MSTGRVSVMCGSEQTLRIHCCRLYLKIFEHFYNYREQRSRTCSQTMSLKLTIERDSITGKTRIACLNCPSLQHIYNQKIEHHLYTLYKGIHFIPARNNDLYMR